MRSAGISSTEMIIVRKINSSNLSLGDMKFGAFLFYAVRFIRNIDIIILL